jgi:hypothetical protein
MRGNPRVRAQRPLPSMMMAMCLGNFSAERPKSLNRRAALIGSKGTALIVS